MTSSDYSLWIIPRGDGKNYAALESFSIHLQQAFAEIGHRVPIVRRLCEMRGRPLVLGPHRILEHPKFFVPANAILINTEHCSDQPSDLQRRFVDLLQHFEVWDFSPRNISILNRMGVKGVKFLELGATGNSRVRGDRSKDIDVLFYGQINDRRREVLSFLTAGGVRVTCLHSVFGKALREAIARAVIVLNIHRIYPVSLEMLRMLDLLPYGQFVISEEGSDHVLEERFRDGIVFARRDTLAEVCKSYLGKPDECSRIGGLGQAAFESIRQAEVLQGLLTENRFDSAKPNR